MVQPVSLHTGEWVLLTPIIPAVGQAPIRFEVIGTPPVVVISPTESHICPASYTVMAAPLDEPHEVTIVESVHNDGTHTFTERIGVSNRTLQPTSWQSNCFLNDPATEIYDDQWMRHSGGDVNVPSPSPPTGEAAALNERWIERFEPSHTVPPSPDPDTLMFYHNPDMSGAGDRPDVGDPGEVTRIYTGMPLLYETESESAPGAGDARIEACAIPLDFGGDPNTYDFADHGQGVGLDVEDEPIWWWRMRMWRRFRPHWQGLRGITRVDNASFFPGEWNAVDENGVSSPLVAYFNTTVGLRYNHFQEVYAYDIDNALLTELTEHMGPVPGTPETYASTHRVMTHRMVRDFTGTPAHIFGNPIPSGYGAIIYRNTTTDLCVAMVAKFLPCNESEGLDTRTSTDDPCMIHCWHREFPWTTDLESSNEGDGMFVTHKTTTKRSAGWVFQVHYMYSGLWANVEEDLQALLQSGGLDQTLTVADLPQSVIDSTLPTSIVPPLPSLIVEDGTGLENANSYSSVDDATGYLDMHRNPDSWLNATTDEREEALRVSTQWLDTRYGTLWVGLKQFQEQALDWPRSAASDNNGYTFVGVPTRLRQATAEMAVRYLEDPTALAPDVGAAAAGNIISQTNTVGPISQSVTYQGATSITEKSFQLVERMIQSGGLIYGGSYVRR